MEDRNGFTFTTDQVRKMAILFRTLRSDVKTRHLVNHPDVQSVEAAFYRRNLKVAK